MKKFMYLVLLILSLSCFHSITVYASENVIELEGTSFTLPDEWLFQEVHPRNDNHRKVFINGNLRLEVDYIEEFSINRKDGFIESFEVSMTDTEYFNKEILSNEDEIDLLYSYSLAKEGTPGKILFRFTGNNVQHFFIYGKKGEEKTLDRETERLIQTLGYENSLGISSVNTDSGRFSEDDIDYAYVLPRARGEYEIYYFFNTTEKTASIISTNDNGYVYTCNYTGDFNNGIQFDWEGLPLSGHFNYWDQPSAFILYENGTEIAKLRSYSIPVLVDYLNSF